MAERLRQQFAKLSLGNRWIGSIPILSAIFIKRKKMKPTGAFRLSKSTKRVLATMNTGMASHFKKMMIEAELAEKVQVRAPRQRDNNSSKE